MITAEHSQITPDNALIHIITSSARLAMLRVLLLDPSRPYYQRQLEVATGLPIRAVQRELERLVASGLLYRWGEGNRMYYQVDREFSLYPELRAMILKTAGPIDRLRGALAVEAAVRLAFYDAATQRVLVVGPEQGGLELPPVAPVVIELMSAGAFVALLSDTADDTHRFLTQGVDLLGRRDDVLWRHIEAAGHEVQKGDGVP